MKTKKIFRTISSQKGQAVVEYMLLLSVVVVLAMLVFKSKLFSEMLGNNSPLFAAFRHIYEHGYNNAFPGSTSTILDNSARLERKHPSYYNELLNDTRFYFVNRPYAP